MKLAARYRIDQIRDHEDSRRQDSRQRRGEHFRDSVRKIKTKEPQWGEQKSERGKSICRVIDVRRVRQLPKHNPKAQQNDAVCNTYIDEYKRRFRGNVASLRSCHALLSRNSVVARGLFMTPDRGVDFSLTGPARLV